MSWLTVAPAPSSVEENHVVPGGGRDDRKGTREGADVRVLRPEVAGLRQESAPDGQGSATPAAERAWRQASRAERRGPEPLEAALLTKLGT